MKNWKFFLFAALAALVCVGLAVAAEQASIDKGKALFNDPKLGTSGKSCNTCHPDGKGLEKAGSKPDLESTINGCISVSLKGTAIDPKSLEMQSMVLYIKSFSAKTTKKPAVGC